MQNSTHAQVLLLSPASALTSSHCRCVFVCPQGCNLSHIIHQLSFGELYPGLQNPLDEVAKIEPDGTIITAFSVLFVVFWIRLCYLLQLSLFILCLSLYLLLLDIGSSIAGA